ncbi:hypothetical protein PFMC_02041 [Plasmodium falciparum CAMP/Malaysia]|uniref:Uncharacterized protein n=1 Tax=Plasmodium falciparum (isolate Camp / Malaysia) TaxID=5835 RepID=A0A024X916_PLAFC|nr:hypothetical protein PFMC_02041 [Plasmodium falciparum CAMP/Malaysia]
MNTALYTLLLTNVVRVKFKKEIEILTKFVTVCDYLKVEILYIGVTLNKCKRFLTDLFIKLKIEENIPCIMK